MLNGVIWLGFGGVSLVRLAGGDTPPTITFWAIAVLMFGNAGAMLFCAFLIGRRNRLFYFFALLVLGVNIILSVTDQVGALDLATLFVDVVLLGILLGGRVHFWPSAS